VPTIHLGKPENNLDDYEKYEIKEIILYILKGIKTENNEVIITLSKLFKWKKLTLEGVLLTK